MARCRRTSAIPFFPLEELLVTRESDSIEPLGKGSVSCPPTLMTLHRKTSANISLNPSNLTGAERMFWVWALQGYSRVEFFGGMRHLGDLGDLGQVIPIAESKTSKPTPRVDFKRELLWTCAFVLEI